MFYENNKFIAHTSFLDNMLIKFVYFSVYERLTSALRHQNCFLY